MISYAERISLFFILNFHDDLTAIVQVLITILFNTTYLWYYTIVKINK